MISSLGFMLKRSFPKEGLYIHLFSSSSFMTLFLHLIILYILVYFI